MGNRQQIQQIPSSLRVTLEKARGEYANTVRKVRWGEGPLFVCGAGNCSALGMAASYPFEMFVGWPVVTRPAAVWQNYSLALLHPRSILLVVAGQGESPEVQELIQSAHERRCTVLALTNNPEGTLAKLADHVFLCHAEGDAESPGMAVGMYAALNFLAFEVMRVLKKPRPFWEQLAREFDELPEKMDWVFTQLVGTLRSVGAEAARVPRLGIIGGGFFEYPAKHAAWRMRSPTSCPLEAFEPSDFLSASSAYVRRDDGVLLLSGSHSKLKKLLTRCAAQARAHGARVLSLTDNNDRDLAEASDLGLLLPPLLEAPASILALFVLEWLAAEMPRKGS